MENQTQEPKNYPPLDLQTTLAPNRVVSLWRLMTGFRLIYLTAILSLGLATVAKTSTYLLLRYFVDEVLLKEGSTTPYWLIALGFVGLAVFEGGFTFLSGRLAASASEGVVLRLRDYLFDHLQRLPVSYHDQTKTGELIQRCTSDVDALRRFFAEQAIGTGRILLLFSINFGVLFSLNKTLALLTIMLIPLVIAISLVFFRKIHAAYEELQEQEGQLSATLQENLAGIRVVKAFAQQQFERDKFEERNQTQYQKGLQLIRWSSVYWPMVEVLSMGQLVVVMYWGALMVLDQTMTIGTYITFLGLAIWIIFPIQNLGRVIVQLSTAMVSYQRVAEIIRQPREQVRPHFTSNGHQQNGAGASGYRPPQSNGHPPSQPGEIIFDNVSLRYGEAMVLHNISFVAKAGQTIALLGPTGAGKSSLVNLLPRFYDANEGTILLDGRPLSQYSLPEIRRQVGIVEQEPFLFSRTLRDNITYGVDYEVSQAEVEAAAKAAAIHEVVLSFPKGYDTIIGERGVTLSGGQKQRIVIARLLLKSPRILIFDDAVSAVDTETERLIQQALAKLRHQRTTFIIAHRIQTIMQADNILVLKKGRIVQQGTHAQLIQQGGIYQQIYNIQANLEKE